MVGVMRGFFVPISGNGEWLSGLDTRLLRRNFVGRQALVASGNPAPEHTSQRDHLPVT